MQSRQLSSRFVPVINPVVVVVFLAAIFAGIVPVASAQTPAPSEVLLNGSFEGLADRANGFAPFFPGAAVSATAADGTQAIDLGRPATTQEWAALGAVAAYAPPGLRFGAVDGLTFQYQVPADLSAAPAVRLQTWFSLDLDGDGVRDECIIHTEPTALAQTTGWATLSIGADTTHYAGGAPCNASAATAPLATFQAAFGAATVLSITVQTALEGGLLAWPAGLPLLVDAVSVQTQQPTPFAAPTLSASVCGGGIRFARIQHAIDCAPAGATVYVPVGSYPENLRIDTNLLGAALDGLVVCRSDDAATACTAGDVLPMVEGSAGAPVVDVLADDVTVQGLALRGGDPVVRVDDADGLTLEAARVDMGPFNAGSSSGIQLVRAHQATIVDNTVQFPANTAGTGGTGVAVQVLGSDDTEVRGNQIIGDLHPAATAVRIVPVFGETYGGTGHIVADNVIVGTHSGIRADATSDLTVSGNTITDSGIGIDLINVQGALVTGNSLAGSESDQLPPDFLGYGVFVRQASTDYTIVGNDISGYHTGVYVGGSANGPGVVSDNRIHGNRANGLLLEGTRPNDAMTVERNTFTDNPQAVHLDTNRPLRLRENRFQGGFLGLSTNPDPARFPTLTIDARLNDWGIDSWRLIEGRASVQDTQTLLQVPFLTSSGHAEPALPHAAPASHSTTPATCDAHPDAESVAGQCRFFTIQAALDFAHAGGRVIVPMSASAVDPAPHFGPLTVDTNNIGESLDQLALCGSVVVFECASVNEPARFALSTGTSWGLPPVLHQGQAVRMTGAGSSTSLFTRDFQGQGAPQVADLTGMGFDLLRESGTCPAGSPRITLRIDTDGDGVVDVPYQVYPSSSFTCPAIGQWVHVDLLASDRWGGALGTTQADAHAALGPAHRVLSMNLIVDGGSPASVFWTDNQRYQDSFFSEPGDDCNDPEDPTCAREEARSTTIVDGTGGSDIVRIAADGVTVSGLTIRHTGAPVASVTGVHLDGVTDPVLIDNRILLEGGGCTPQQVVSGVCYDPFKVNGVAGTSQNAVISGNEIAAAPVSPTGDGSIGGTDGIVGEHVGALVSMNALRGWAANAVYLRGADAVVESNNFRLNAAHVLLCGGADGSVVQMNEMLLAFQAVAFCGATAPADVRVNNNLLGLTNGMGAVVRAGTGPVVADLTCNDWGIYNGVAIRETRISQDNGMVNVLQSEPFTAPDGTNGLGCLLAPVADFTATTLTPVRNEVVTFQDISVQGSKPLVLREWDFGDGTTDVRPEVEHSYPATGLYDVTLRVQDADGMTATVIKQVNVENQLPQLRIAGGPTIGELETLGLAVYAPDPDADGVSIVASGVPAGAIFQVHGSGFASMSWTPPAGSAGDYTVTFTATDSLGGIVADSITITVLDSLGPVDFTNVRDLVLVEGYVVPTTVKAVDDTGDPVALSASGLPAWATFADAGNGRGEFGWAPPVGTAPTTFVVSLTATAGADTVLRTFSVEVIPRADIELVPVGPSIVAGSPDDAVPLQVEVRNVGLSDATVELAATAEAGWATSIPASVFVPALSSVVVSFSATPDFGDATSRVHLSASAVGFPGETESLYWRINVPVLASVSFVPAPSTTGGVIGEVTAVYLNGAPAVGLAVRMEQRPPLNVGNLLTTSVSGSADGNGTFAFDFGTDPSSRLPGEHGFTATVTYGSRQYLAAGTFEVVVA